MSSLIYMEAVFTVQCYVCIIRLLVVLNMAELFTKNVRESVIDIYHVVTNVYLTVLCVLYMVDVN